MSDNVEALVAWVAERLPRTNAVSELVERRDVGEFGTVLFYLPATRSGLPLEVVVGRTGECYLAIGSVAEVELTLEEAGDRSHFEGIMRALDRGMVALARHRGGTRLLLGAPEVVEDELSACVEVLRIWAPAVCAAAAHTTDAMPLVVLPAHHDSRPTGVRPHTTGRPG